jgi:hypothetical protein
LCSVLKFSHRGIQIPVQTFSDRRWTYSTAGAANALVSDSDLVEQDPSSSGYEVNAEAGSSSGSHQGNCAFGLSRSYPRTISLDAESL